MNPYLWKVIVFVRAVVGLLFFIALPFGDTCWKVDAWLDRQI